MLDTYIAAANQKQDFKFTKVVTLKYLVSL